MNKGLNEHGNINSYFRYNSLDGFGVDIPAVLSTRLDDITPATKEYKQSYVPDFISIEDTGYGDYVYLNIDGTGHIEHFDVVKSKIESYFDDLNED